VVLVKSEDWSSTRSRCCCVWSFCLTPASSSRRSYSTSATSKVYNGRRRLYNRTEQGLTSHSTQNRSFRRRNTTGALPVNKPGTTAMVTIARWPQVSHNASSYTPYSRRHVIGYRRRPASLWLVRQVRLIITRAVRHLAITTLGMTGGDAFRAVSLTSKASR